jgi:predicted small lipoprotein YifL
MKISLGLIVLLAAMTLLAGCADEGPTYVPNGYYPDKPFMQTDPGSMSIHGPESSLPNSPGYH